MEFSICSSTRLFDVMEYISACDQLNASFSYWTSIPLSYGIVYWHLRFLNVFSLLPWFFSSGKWVFDLCFQFMSTYLVDLQDSGVSSCASVIISGQAMSMSPSLYLTHYLFQRFNFSWVSTNVIGGRCYSLKSSIDGSIQMKNHVDFIFFDRKIIFNILATKQQNSWR